MGRVHSRIQCTHTSQLSSGNNKTPCGTTSIKYPLHLETLIWRETTITKPVCVYTRVCVFVCVCVRARECAVCIHASRCVYVFVCRCVCVCVCVCVSVCVVCIEYICPDVYNITDYWIDSYITIHTRMSFRPPPTHTLYTANSRTRTAPFHTFVLDLFDADFPAFYSKGWDRLKGAYVYVFVCVFVCLVCACLCVRACACLVRVRVWCLCVF